VSFVSRVLDTFGEKFEVGSMERHAKHASDLDLAHVTPGFSK